MLQNILKSTFLLCYKINPIASLETIAKKGLAFDFCCIKAWFTLATEAETETEAEATVSVSVSVQVRTDTTEAETEASLSCLVL